LFVVVGAGLFYNLVVRRCALNLLNLFL
jgi:hypothetical protein